ncbi:MAG: SRPBCC domain-containing protein [Myxococcales bacterium]|nr:SRPBCC domain-containing protein [Myxococcales bacterium]
MDASKESGPMKNPTTVERKSDRELVATRTFNAPARIVFDAWTTAELFKRWWVPRSCPIVLLACDMDVRVGGKYRLVFGHGDSPPMEVFGRYLEVTPPSRLSWTNEETGDGGAITTITFEEKDGKTVLVMHDLYPLVGGTHTTATSDSFVTDVVFARASNRLPQRAGRRLGSVLPCAVRRCS